MGHQVTSPENPITKFSLKSTQALTTGLNREASGLTQSKTTSKGCISIDRHSLALRFQKNKNRANLPTQKCLKHSRQVGCSTQRGRSEASQAVFFPRSITPVTHSIKGPWTYTKRQLRHPVPPDVMADLKPTRQVHHWQSSTSQGE